MNINKIPGLTVQSTKWNEALLLCKILISPSDAENLHKNKKVKSILMNQIIESLETVVKQMKERNSEPN